MKVLLTFAVVFVIVGSVVCLKAFKSQVPIADPSPISAQSELSPKPALIPEPAPLLVDVFDIESLLEPAPIPPADPVEGEIILVVMNSDPIVLLPSLPAPEFIPLADDGVEIAPMPRISASPRK